MDSIQTQLAKKQCHFGNFSVVSNSTISSSSSQPIPIQINHRSPIKFVTSNHPDGLTPRGGTSMGGKVSSALSQNGGRNAPSTPVNNSSISTLKSNSSPLKPIQLSQVRKNENNFNNVKGPPQLSTFENVRIKECK